MTPRLARWLVRLYPERWRRRYGAALIAQVELLVAAQLVAAVAGHPLELGLAAGGLVFFRLEGPLSVHVGGGLVLVAAAAGLLAARRQEGRYADGAPRR